MMQAMEADAVSHAGVELQVALMESRQRWRCFGALATDMAFEIDCTGRLTYLAPDQVLGLPASVLLGMEAAALLAGPEPNPFGTPVPQRRRRCWLRAPGGAPACMELTVQPVHDAAGRLCGWRGVGVDVTDQERKEAATAATLRRGEALDHILGQMRQEVMAPRMMAAVLSQTTEALGGDGALVVDLSPPLPPGDGAFPLSSPVLHAAGASLSPAMLAQLLPRLRATEDDRSLVLPDGSLVLASRCATRFGLQAAMLTWRHAPARPWDEDDRLLAAAVAGVIRIVLEHETIQRELAHQARTDALTGLLNRRAFMEEAARRLDRLDADQLTGTLLFIDLDHFKQLNDTSGHEAGDDALVLCAKLLLRTFRPTDLVARLGGDEFAVWLDNADHLTAAERAETLTTTISEELAAVTEGAQPLGMSVGIATRVPGSGETLDEVVSRADLAMYDVKRAGRGRWRVARPLDVL